MTAPLLVRVEDTRTHAWAIHAFHSSPLRIGRDPSNELSLSHPFLSEFHARVEFDDDGVRYVDLGSTNGTRLGGQLLANNVPIALSPEFYSSRRDTTRRPRPRAKLSDSGPICPTCSSSRATF